MMILISVISQMYKLKKGRKKEKYDEEEEQERIVEDEKGIYNLGHRDLIQESIDCRNRR